MKQDDTNNRLLLGVVGGAAIILMTMITAIFLVSRRPIVVLLPEKQSVSSGVTLPAATGGPVAPATPAEDPPPEILVSRIAMAPAIDNPLDPAWEKVAIVEVNLTPQQVAQPVLEQGTITKLGVQSVRDDKRFVWRLSWDKSQIADHIDTAVFTDAVAMQFPLVDNAPYTMGGPNLPVRMLYWRAAWQRDVDKGFQGLAGLHPNTDADLYWFSQSKTDGVRHESDGSVDNEMAKQWMVAAKSGNPMTDFHRKQPVEELTAHGFGSGTHVTDTPTQGRGVWQKGRWYVVFDRPINAEDPLIERFNASPEKQMVAFAVWDGDNANRGGKKQITNWLPMRISQ